MEYRARNPRETALYSIVNDHLNIFLCKHPDIPIYAVKELNGFLRCGIFDYGFARFKCDSCPLEKMVAFSCKKRGFCPSCAGRRMSETSIKLTDHILPDLPYRQWVLTLPIALRYWLAKSSKLLTMIHKIFIDTVSDFYERRVEATFDFENTKAGSFTGIQRFGSSLALNIHFHTVFPEGAFVENSTGGVDFHRSRPPRNEDVASLLKAVAEKTIVLLRRLGFLKEQAHEDEEADVSCLFEKLDEHERIKLASSFDVIAFGENAGQKPRRLIGCGFGDEDERVSFRGELSAYVNGFSLHAATFVKQHRIHQLAQLLRYILRPPLSNERLEILSDGDIQYKMKRRFSDGSTHVVFSPEEFLERLVALIPIQYIHLVRYSGVFASASPLRSRVIKSSSKEKMETSQTSRIEWSELLKRTFGIDITQCSCGGKLRLIALISERGVIAKILRHMALKGDPPGS